MFVRASFRQEGLAAFFPRSFYTDVSLKRTGFPHRASSALRQGPGGRNVPWTSNTPLFHHRTEIRARARLLLQWAWTHLDR